MNRKIFQLFFVLIIITAFGVIIKNYVDSIISDFNDYKLILSKPPQTEISRLAPFKIEFLKEINTNKYQVNVPIENDIVKTKPEIDGYIYFTDNKTLEFQPNLPLKAGFEYNIKVDIEKLYPESKYKPFHYKVKTPVISFKTHFNDITYFDSANTASPYLSGFIAFNDFVEYEKKIKILKAYQNNKLLEINYAPGQEDNILEFNVKNIERSNTEQHVNVFWNGNAIGSNVKDSTFFSVVEIDSFKVVSCHTTYFPSPLITVKFSDIIAESTYIDSLIWVNGFKPKQCEVYNNKLIIPFSGELSQNNTLLLSKQIEGKNGNKLNNNFKYNFTYYNNNTHVGIKDTNHYRNIADYNSFLEIQALNLKQVELEVFHVPDKNMMQFLQVNNIDGNKEIQRVGKSIFKKNYNLESKSHFNPMALNTFDLDLIGANFSEPGLYNLNFNYTNNHLIHNTPNNNLKNSHFNIIFSSISANAKFTTTDTLYILISNLKTNTPLRNARIEIFDYQQNKLATLISNTNGIAKTYINERNLLLRIEHNNEISYLKINNDQQTQVYNNSGIKSSSGYLCYIDGLKKKYNPNDSIKLAIILKKNGFVNKANFQFNVGLTDPSGNKHQTEIINTSSNALINFQSKIPYDAQNGKWNLYVTKGNTNFNYEFFVDNTHEYNLPITFNYIKKRNQVNIISTNKNAITGNLKIKLSINSTKKTFQNHESLLLKSPYDSLLFTAAIKLDKYGKAQIKLPNWIKNLDDFEIKAEHFINSNTGLKQDTVITLNNNKISGNEVPNGKNTAHLLDATHQTVKANQNISNIKKDSTANNFGFFRNNIGLKEQYKIGDSATLKIKGIDSIRLITVENSEQVFHEFWVNNINQTLKFEITSDMHPGAYVTICNKNCKNLLYHFGVELFEEDTEKTISVNAPYDWAPLKPVKYSITNNNESNIQLLVILNSNADSLMNDKNIKQYFHQQQLNSIINYSSTKKGLLFEPNTELYQNSASIANQTKQAISIHGPFALAPNQTINNTLLAPNIKGDITLSIIGFNNETGAVIEENVKAQIYEPLSIHSNHPQYVNAGDLVEFDVDIYNNTPYTDTIIIELRDFQNLDIVSNIENTMLIKANSKALFSVTSKFNNILGQSSFSINIKHKNGKANQKINIPILANPSYLVNSGSSIILPDKQWQKRVTPFGIKGTNNAVFEFSLSHIPNIKKLVSNLNENNTDNTLSIINKTFPLLYYNELILNEDLINDNKQKIDNSLIKLHKFQHTNGSFVLQNSENEIWTNSYIGHYMLIAKKLGYKVNQAMLNKWVRYQKNELQRLKATWQKESENYHYLLYTLALAEAIDLKNFNLLINKNKNSFINNLHIACTYSLLKKEKAAITYFNLNEAKSKHSLYELALMLNNAVALKNESNIKKYINEINAVIEQKNNNPTYVAVALSTVLRALYVNKSNAGYGINYQINNGKTNTYNSSTPISYLNIPLEFTLAKNTDFYNTNTDTLYINLWQTGNPQVVSNPTTSLPNLRISNNYNLLNGAPANLSSLNKNDFVIQNLTYSNIGKASQNISITLPVASGLKVKYCEINGIQYSPTIHNGYIDFNLQLKGNDKHELIILYECVNKGYFNTYPIKVFNNNKLYQKAFTKQPKVVIN